MSGSPKVIPKVSPKVSVGLPCRNAAATLPAALDSLLAQTLSDFEIIAVDDGSTDATWDVLCAYARQDPRMRPLRQRHLGVALAWNAALEASRAPHIARMDADDLCLPRRLEAQAALLDADPTLGLVSGLVRFGGDRKKRQGYAVHVDWLNSLLTPEAISVNRFVDSPIANPSVMFRRELFERLGGARPNTSAMIGDAAGASPFPEDYEMWLRWLERGVRMGKVAEEVLVWNDPPTRLTRTADEYSVEAFARIKAQYLWRWLIRKNPGHPRVWVWGAGRVSRQKLAPLLDMGLVIEAFIDIDARKIGQTIHGIPVLPRTAIPPYSPSDPATPFILANVASRGAREEIMARLEGLGYQMGVGAVAVG
ncbi:MAG: glycosyl transferase family 2 [Deltaproteobacteria bacterium HGW-Deltaproteobacteria-8]|jgi:glycosyltransferase involved in cell wall biosynthesis|nr:MAG: glycosyl transferase family 2 [Deltaproteobacteria bacterium HGW-Deltaproteobacteria-8]